MDESERAGWKPATVDEKTGRVTGPWHCGQPMDDDGGCSEGCCDDYKCGVCGKRIRVEWPD